ncbi:MAG: response regulator [Drouetiella hepatica Uher 2000/2452]|jgi:CheY-like chemotaxis protein|uniref:Response regulator n=1 Tax=Drouetiella hepatica Uher 2000/2452 TaxID=904376 RepID=A0A951QFA3_9CYAN|nr:response regulator [Drouetiella hepatica Uher 2000/2452]
MSRILVVDDFVDNLLFIKALFESEEYTVDTATSGFAAIDLVEELRPDVVLLDIFLSDMIGYTVVERIRQNPKLTETRIVLSTASSVLDESEAMASGADVFLRKPFDSDHLLVIVKKLCARNNDRQKIT